MKNYYQILGVLDDAEDIVIRAAFRALAQKYHPDKWSGDANFATGKMAEINEAYDILSDKTKRNEYNKSYFSAFGKNNAESTFAETADAYDYEDEGWNLAVDFFPDLQTCYAELAKISKILANTFKTKILFTKEFKNSLSLKVQLENSYLARFYGSDQRIKDFAKELLVAGHSRAAIKLNKIILHLGTSVDYKVIREKIETEFPDVRQKSSQNTKSKSGYIINFELQNAVDRVKHNIDTYKDLIIILEFFKDIKIARESGFISHVYTFKIDGVMQRITIEELRSQAKEVMLQHGLID